MKCPNKNTKEWKALVSLFGETNTMLAYIRNDEEIPSIVKASSLLEGRINLNKTVNKRPRRKISEELMKTFNESKDPVEAIKTLIIDKSGDSSHAKLFKYLQPALEKAVNNERFLGFKALEDEASVGAIMFTDQGYFVNLTPSAFNYSEDFYADLSYVILHELVHLVTLFPILTQHANKLGYYADVPSELKEPLERLHKLYTHVKKITPPGEFKQALKNEKEFVAYALTNRDFITYLNSISYNKKNLLSRIVEMLKDLFKAIVPGSAFNEALDIIDSIILGQMGNPHLSNELYAIFNKESVLFEKVLLEPEKLVTSDKSDFYEDGVVKKLRTSNVVRELSPFAKKSETNEEYFTERAKQFFRDKGLAQDETYKKRTASGMLMEEYTLEQYADYLKDSREKPRLEGKAIHAWYVAEKLKDIDNLRAEEYRREFKRHTTELKASELDIEDYKKRAELVDDLLADEFLGTESLAQYEFVLSLDLEPFTYGDTKVQGIGGTSDIIIDHGNSVYSLYDIKTGNLLESPFTATTPLLKFAREAGIMAEDTAKNRYSISMALYAMMIKVKDPKAVFNAIKLLHIPKNGRPEAVWPDLGTGLAILARYFEANHSEFYEKNKALFSAKNYITESSDINIGINAMKEKGFSQPKVAFKTDQIVKFRELVRQKARFEEKKPSARTDQENEKYAKVSLEYQKLMESIVELELGTNPFKEQGFKNMNFMQYLFHNRYNSKNSLIRSLNDYYAKRKVMFDKEYLSVRKKQRSLVSAVLKEFRASKRAPILGSDYKDIFEFLWDDGYMTTYKSEKWNKLTKAQKEYADFHRWGIRFNLFATMSPTEGVHFIKQELKERNDIAEKDKATLENQIQLLESLPPYNKFKDYKYLNNFQYFEGWSPRMGKRKEEITGSKESLKEYFSLSLKEAEIITDEDYINTLFPKEYESTLGLSPKFFGDLENATEKQEQGEYTWNSEFVFDAFVNNMLQKRYFDDVYNIGLGIKDFMMEEDKHSTRRSNRYNILFLDSFLKGTILKKPTDMVNMTIKLAGKEFKLDALARMARSYFGVTTLALNFVGAATAGISQTFRTIIQAISGSGVKIFLGTDKEKDMSLSDMSKAFTKVMEWKRSQLPYKLQKDDLLLDNKLHLMLQEWDYLPNSYIYEDAYKSGGATAQGLILPTWVNNELLLKLYSSVDNVNYATYLMGQLMHHKVDKKVNGQIKKVSLWEAYEVEDGELVYKGEARGVDRDTGEVLKELNFREIDKLRAFAERDLGSYRSDERSYVDNSTIGALFMMFKRWLPAMVRRAFSRKFDNYTLGEYIATGKTIKDIDGIEMPELEWVPRSDEGYVTSLLSGMWVLGLYIKDLSTKGRVNSDFSKLNEAQKRNVIYAISKVMTFFGLYFTFLMLYGDDVDDDDKNAIKRASARIRDEVVFEFIFFPGANSLEDWKRVSTSVPVFDKATTTLGGYITWFTGMGKEEIFGMEGQRLQSGPYKGWYKGTIPALRGTKYISTGLGLTEVFKAYEDIEEDLQRLQ